jgi:hypothetical protein
MHNGNLRYLRLPIATRCVVVWCAQTYRRIVGTVTLLGCIANLSREGMKSQRRTFSVVRPG